MSGFHRCVTCGTKLPANDPHEDCVSCLGPGHAASALADRAFCTSYASFQTRTLRHRVRRAVGDHSPSSGSSHTLAAPQSSLASPPVKLPLSRSSSSQLSAGQLSPDARRRKDRSHSPPVVQGPSPRAPTLGPALGRLDGEDVPVLLVATARATDEPVGPVANQPMVLPQPLSVPVAQQDAWDVDAISRDASEGEPLPREGSVEAELTSHHSESEMEVGVDDSLWSLVERATRHLGIEWPAVDKPRRSLFESPSAQGQQFRTLPAFPDFIKAALVKDLPDYPLVSLRTELGLIAQLLVKVAQPYARALGRSIVSLVVARR
ncbi:UNVERIFIED_CONTAM: hypothetical protein FKN15_064018 [Acipenser sinensis]